jgi:hypothetical protein
MMYFFQKKRKGIYTQMQRIGLRHTSFAQLGRVHGECQINAGRHFFTPLTEYPLLLRDRRNLGWTDTPAKANTSLAVEPSLLAFA